MAKPRKNYSAWHIDATKFSDRWSPLHKLEFFARYAVLAPSGHNTQPWLFATDGESLVLHVNPERKLPFSGELAAEPYISIGACLEIFHLAATGFGYAVNTDYLMDGTSIVKLSLGKRTTPRPELLKAITHRVSNRSLYKSAPPSPDTLAAITKHRFGHASLHLVTDKEGIDYLAEKTLEATAEIMTEQAFRDELSKWVRNNVTRQHDGMPGFVQGMPTPPSLLAKHIVRRFDISKGQSKLDAKRVKATPIVALLCAKDDNPRSYLEVGRLYARISVQAAQIGVNTSGISAATVSQTTKKAIAKHLSLPSLPTALMRIGYATAPARHTPRWPLEFVRKQS